MTCRNSAKRRARLPQRMWHSVWHMRPLVDDQQNCWGAGLSSDMNVGDVQCTQLGHEPTLRSSLGSTIIFNQPHDISYQPSRGIENFGAPLPKAQRKSQAQGDSAEPPTERSRQWKATKLTSIHGRPTKKDTTTPQDSGGIFHPYAAAKFLQMPAGNDVELGRCLVESHEY